jgi:undecaprenyl-diphosphatase
MGLGRDGAARFSFLLSIPVIVLAGGLQLFELLGTGEAVDWTAMAIGTALAAASAYACIHYFLTFIRRIGMQPFVAYRLVLGLILLLIFL